jgi:hypothetical protein
MVCSSLHCKGQVDLVDDTDGEVLDIGQAAGLGDLQDDRMVAGIGVGRRTGERCGAVAVVGQGQPGWQRRRSDGDCIAVQILGGDGIGVGDASAFGR